MKTLTPAYGADYKTKAEVVEAYNSNKDFIIHDISDRWNGLPANKLDLGDTPVKIYFSKLRKYTVLN